MSRRGVLGVRRFPFPAQVIVVAVRWYLRYGLSYLDVQELLVEPVSRSTTPPSAARTRRPTGSSGVAKTHPCWKREVPADFWIIETSNRTVEARRNAAKPPAAPRPPQVSSGGFDEPVRSHAAAHPRSLRGNPGSGVGVGVGGVRSRGEWPPTSGAVASPSLEGGAAPLVGEVHGAVGPETVPVSRSFRLAAVAAAVVLIAAGCSGSRGRPRRSHSGKDPNVKPEDIMRVISCFRAHGLPNYPDPSYDPVDGRWHYPDQPPPLTAQVRQACAAVMPQSTPASPVPTAELNDLLTFARCVRAHGMPQWPDPAVDGVFHVGALPDTKSDPIARAAVAACNQYLASSGGRLQIGPPNG